MEANFFGFSWGIWGVFCWVIALIYTFIWPRPKSSGKAISPLQYFILRWFHALTWALLGVSCFTRLLHFPEQVSNLIAFFAFGVYVVFLVVMSNSRVRK